MRKNLNQSKQGVSVLYCAFLPKFLLRAVPRHFRKLALPSQCQEVLFQRRIVRHRQRHRPLRHGLYGERQLGNSSKNSQRDPGVVEQITPLRDRDNFSKAFVLGGRNDDSHGHEVLVSSSAATPKAAAMGPRAHHARRRHAVPGDGLVQSHALHRQEIDKLAKHDSRGCGDRHRALVDNDARVGVEASGADDNPPCVGSGVWTREFGHGHGVEELGLVGREERLGDLARPAIWPWTSEIVLELAATRIAFY
ncbi:uncharacterized protein LOC112346669 [Selaginella moellendorffii]|uniref:uncharacterized protein LOC112346669 n=1 Tax=Selaginella moellendorffii TaxID=88036 RepID=UPI000D1D0550|nr:uncharacterized protein LOC112346669 [Selaginella moellendorffii]|eukprot:XP_024531928.1 uncharacterized protein LOC112346669 [Selaginella moellendorffii]